LVEDVLSEAGFDAVSLSLPVSKHSHCSMARGTNSERSLLM
jgi:hypothetical protein